MDFLIVVIITMIVGLYNVGVGHGFGISDDDIELMNGTINEEELSVMEVPMRTNIEMKCINDAWCDIVKELGLM